MTRKHYEEIARGIRILMDGHATDRHTAKGAAQVATLRSLAHFYADSFSADNPRFDRDRFLVACHYYERQLDEVAATV